MFSPLLPVGFPARDPQIPFPVCTPLGQWNNVVHFARVPHFQPYHSAGLVSAPPPLNVRSGPAIAPVLFLVVSRHLASMFLSRKRKQTASNKMPGPRKEKLGKRGTKLNPLQPSTVVQSRPIKAQQANKGAPESNLQQAAQQFLAFLEKDKKDGRREDSGHGPE